MIIIIYFYNYYLTHAIDPKFKLNPRFSYFVPLPLFSAIVLTTRRKENMVNCSDVIMK